jgi:hypothetical protein
VSPLAIAIVAAAALGALSIAEGVWIHADQVEIDAMQQKLDDMTGQRNQQAVGLRSCENEKSVQQSEIDAGDRAARETAQRQQAARQQLEIQNADLQAGNDHLIQQLEEAIDARSAKFTVRPVYPTGWDPLVASAAGYIRRLQLARSGDGADAALDRIPGQISPGGPGAAGATSGATLAAIADAGAPEARPDAKQQADLLGYVGRLYHWGDACYRDKAAIAASQRTGPVAP